MSCPSCHGCSSSNTHRDPFSAKDCDPYYVSDAGKAVPDEPQFQRYLLALNAALSDLDNATVNLERSTEFFRTPIEMPLSPMKTSAEPEPDMSPLTHKLRDMLEFTQRLTERVNLLNTQLIAS